MIEFETKSEKILHDLRNLLSVLNVTVWQIEQDVPQKAQEVEEALTRHRQVVVEVAKLLEQLEVEIKP